MGAGRYHRELSTRLAYHARLQQMLVSFEGSNRISLLTETIGAAGGAPINTISLSDAFAAEVTPAAFVSNNRIEALFALNAISNTITVIPYAVAVWTPTQFTALATYASEMLQAYVDLIAVALQYLKDAFCELLLLKCPTCDQESDQPVYLAGITVKEGRVWKVCNFSQRRYVKTFPGVEYWLSVVPILPIVELAIREFCCLTFTGLFSSFKQPQGLALSVAKIPSAPEAFSAVTKLKTLNFSGLTTTLQNRIAPVTGTATDYVKTLFGGAAPASAPSVPANSVTGQPLAQAQKALGDQKILVDVKPYDAASIRANIVRATAAPSQIPAGSAVTLYTDAAGNVKGFEIASPQVQALTAQVKSVEQTQAAAEPLITAAPAIEADVAALKIQLANLQTTHQQELATRDAQIAQLMASAQQIQSSLGEFKTQIAKLVPPRG